MIFKTTGKTITVQTRRTIDNRTYRKLIGGLLIPIPSLVSEMGVVPTKQKSLKNNNKNMLRHALYMCNIC